MKQIVEFSTLIYLFVFVIFNLSSLFIKKSHYRLQYQLTGNVNHRKIMGRFFVLCYSVTHKHITFTYHQERRVLKYHKYT